MDKSEEREAIISLIFPRPQNTEAGDPHQTYISHLKVWEEGASEGGPMKLRYIVLSENNNGSGILRKSRLNGNNTFSIGKTWQLAELRRVKVLSPYIFSVTFSKTYEWRSETRGDQARFLETLVKLFRKVTSGTIPLQLIGIHDSLFISTPSREQNRAPEPPMSNCIETSHSTPVEQSTIKKSSAEHGQALHSARCYFCDSQIAGDRYKCLDCPDFDSCDSCFVIVPQQHPHHGFVRIKAAGDYIPVRSSSKPMHAVTCNGCSMTIYGCRFKCMHPECSDYDLCENCEALPIPLHPELHPMLKIKLPETLIPSVHRNEKMVPTSQPKPSVIPENVTTVALEIAEPQMESEKADRSPLPTANPFASTGDSTLSRSTIPSHTVVEVASNSESGAVLESVLSNAPNQSPTDPEGQPLKIVVDKPSITVARLEVPSTEDLFSENATGASERHSKQGDDFVTHDGIAESPSTGALVEQSSITQSRSRDTFDDLPEEDKLSDAGSDIFLVDMPSSPIDEDDEVLFRESRLDSPPATSSNGYSRPVKNASSIDYVLVDDS